MLADFRKVVPLLALLALPAGAFAQDSDLDGVVDASDQFPCDPQRSAEAFAPAEGAFGQVLFEDFWPAALDFDFNDAVVAYNYAFAVGADGGVRQIRATFSAIAASGTVDLGLGLGLPFDKGLVGSATVQIGGGAVQVLSASAGDQTATFVLSADLRADVFGAAPGTPVNGAGSAVASQPIEVVVDIPAGVRVDPADAPFDLFVFRAGTPGHEIHTPDHCGTAAMDPSLFGTGIDASDRASGRCFVDQGGRPFALLVPEATLYPLEDNDIADLYPAIIAWAASGGASNADWYTAPASNFAFTSAPLASFGASGPSFTKDSACTPKSTCVDLLLAGQTADGVYTVDPDGAGPAGPTDVYCDMSTSGGGWTLALNLDTSDGHVMWWHNPRWTDATFVGADSPDLDGDYKGQPWLSTSTYEIMLVVHQQGLVLGYKAFAGANPARSMSDWLGAGTNLQISSGVTDSWTSAALWSGEHLVRDSHQLWVNQNDAFDGRFCNTQDWDRICSDTCKVGGNDGGGLGNCHDCAQDPYWRTTAEAQAGWHNWTASGGCYAGTPHNRLGHFGSDTAYPATGANRNVANNASWSTANGYAYDYAIFVRDRAPIVGAANSCRSLYANGQRTDGMYSIDPDGAGPIAPANVYCDMSADGGGWALVQVGLNQGQVSLRTDGAAGSVTHPNQTTSGKLSRAFIAALLQSGERTFRYGRPSYGQLFIGPLQDDWISNGIGAYNYGTQVTPNLVRTALTGATYPGSRFAWPLDGQPAACSNTDGTTGECAAGLHIGTWHVSGGQPAVDGAYVNGSSALGGPQYWGIDYALWVR